MDESSDEYGAMVIAYSCLVEALVTRHRLDLAALVEDFEFAEQRLLEGGSGGVAVLVRRLRRNLASVRDRLRPN